MMAPGIMGVEVCAECGRYIKWMPWPQHLWDVRNKIRGNWSKRHPQESPLLPEPLCEHCGKNARQWGANGAMPVCGTSLRTTNDHTRAELSSGRAREHSCNQVQKRGVASVGGDAPMGCNSFLNRVRVFEFGAGALGCSLWRDST